METAAKTEKAVIQLAPGELWPFEHISTRHDASIAIGIPPETLSVPAFWAHHATKLKPMDEIRARAEDGTWVAYCLVLDCSRTWAKVQVLAFYRLTTADVSLTQASEAEVKAFLAAHAIVWRGAHKWSVVRSADSAVLQEGLRKEQAEAWLESHARAQVGTPAALRQAVTA